MPWKCPQCGVDDIDDSLSSHLIESGGCGYVRFPAGVILRSDASGKEITVRVGGSFGSSSLKLLGDPDIRFVSTEQFMLEKCTAKRGWLLINNAKSQNHIFLNGSPLGLEGEVLKQGDKISIKDKYFHLTVHLLHSL